MLVKPRSGERTYPCTFAVNHLGIDVFDNLSQLGMTDTAYVVGSGEEGGANVSRIDSACWSVACNGAITLPVDFDAWAAYDGEVPTRDYYQSIPRDLIWIMGNNIGGDVATYVYDFHPAISQSQALTFGQLHAGGTIAGCMLQLLYWAGCRHAILCGVDMFGNRYHDGTVSPYHHPDTDWGLQMENMNLIIKLCEAGGMRVSSISDTALDVVVI